MVYTRRFCYNITMPFSKNLFWDADSEKLDLRSNMRYVIQRVLDRGTLDDLRTAVEYYGQDVIVDVAKSLRTLEPRALSFISCIANVPREEFRCYTLKQSSQAPWIS